MVSKVVIAMLVTVTAAVASTAWESDHLDSMGRGKKQDKMLQEMMQALMLAKNMISFALMFVSPIIQIKGFGLSVVNTLINIGRFLVQLHATQQMKQMHMAHLGVHYPNVHGHTHDSEDLWSAASSSNQYAYYAPPPKGLVRQDPGVIENLPPVHASYTSGRHQEQVYPHYSSNSTWLR